MNHSHQFKLAFLLLLLSSTLASAQESPDFTIPMPYNVENFAFSADGKTVGVLEREAQIWDLQQKRLLRTYVAPEGMGGTPDLPFPFNHIALSEHGEWAACSVMWGDWLFVWNTRTGETVQKIKIPSNPQVVGTHFDIEAIDLSGDGSMVAAIREGGVFVYRTGDGQLLHAFLESNVIFSRVFFLKQTPQLFFPVVEPKTGLDKGKTFDVFTGNEIHSFPGIYFLKARNWVIHLFAEQDDANGTLQAYDALTGDFIKEWKGMLDLHWSSLFDLSPDGKYMIYGKDNQVRIKRLNDNGEITTARTIPYTGPTIRNGFKFSGDGKLVGVVNGSRLDIYDVSDLTSKIKDQGMY